MKAHKILALVPSLALTLGVSPRNRISIDDIRTMSFDVAVTDKSRIPVRGLDRPNFKVFVDNVEQTLTRVSQHNKPLAMVVVVELDEAFAYNMPNSVEPAVGLLKALHPKTGERSAHSTVIRKWRYKHLSGIWGADATS
jgi:hypothetical protein